MAKLVISNLALFVYFVNKSFTVNIRDVLPQLLFTQ